MFDEFDEIMIYGWCVYFMTFSAKMITGFIVQTFVQNLCGKWICQIELAPISNKCKHLRKVQTDFFFLLMFNYCEYYIFTTFSVHQYFKSRKLHSKYLCLLYTTLCCLFSLISKFLTFFFWKSKAPNWRNQEPKILVISHGFRDHFQTIHNLYYDIVKMWIFIMFFVIL